VTIVIGYTPTSAGRAALTAITEARKSDRLLVVVNTSRGNALDDLAFAQPADLTGYAPRWRKPVSPSRFARMCEGGRRPTSSSTYWRRSGQSSA
jgi:aspartate aminotransferase-like enzyme